MKKLAFCLMALTPAFAFAAPGFYASLDAGVNTVNASNALQNSTVGFVGGGAAGYLWGDNTLNYGVEAAGLVYPNSNGSKDIGAGHDWNSSYDGYNLSLLAVLKYTSCSNGFTGFVKAGGAYVHQQLFSNINGSGSFNSFSPKSNEDGDFAFETQVGVGYFFTSNLEADVSWDHVFAEDQSNSDLSAGRMNAVENDNFLVGVTYHFA